jgi:hypothetical protein
MSSARALLRVVMLVGALLLGLTASSASATTGHSFADQFGAAGNGDGQFVGGPSGVAVLQSSDDVLVSDPGHTLVDGVTPDPRVERFDDAGVFVSAFSIDGAIYSSPNALAVDPAGAGAVYISAVDNGTGGGAVLKYSAAGAFAYALDASSSGTTINPGASVAIDPVDGTVYVAATDSNTGLQVVDKFDQAGAFVTSFDGASGSPDGGLSYCGAGPAVGASHEVYVLDPCKGRVDRYTAAGVWVATVDAGSGGAPVAVTADPVSGEVLVAESGGGGLQVTSFPDGATPGQVFSTANVGGPAGLAVDHGSGTVFTADVANAVVQRFTAFAGPTVTTTAAAPVEATAVTLNGTVDPAGVAATYHFEYGLTAAYGTSTPQTGAGSGSAAVPVSAGVTALNPNTTYHYRIVGANGSGSITGQDLTLTTATTAPVLDGSAAFASAITPTSVSVHGAVNPRNSPTVYHFEYGTTTAYGLIGPDGDAGSGNADGAVSSGLSGLVPGTAYHFRLVADNGTGGPQVGADQTFITAPAAPAGASDVTATKATLKGTINAHGAASTYHFNYGANTSYGVSTPETDGGDTDGDHLVTQQLAGLSPDTTYHVQVVTTTDGVVRNGADGLFRTAPAPTGTAAYATGVSTSAATLVGSVDTHNATGTYHFEVASIDSAYTTVTGDRQAPAQNGAQQVTTPVAGLPAGETFRVRLVVSSNDATGYSDQILFATAPAPPVLPVSPISDPTKIYGCTAPSLDTYNKKARPGDIIAITGHDLGSGATVALGSRSFAPADWSASGFTLQVPDDATGTLPLTINCGRVSNTIAVAVFHEPDNTFTITRPSVKGTTATLSVKLPGPGKVEISGNHIKAAKITVTKTDTAVVKIRLSSAGLKGLGRAKGRSLKVGVRVRYTPAGGHPASETVAVTFTRKAGHP